MKNDANDLVRKPKRDWEDLGTVNTSLQDFKVIGASSYDSVTSEFERFTDQFVRLSPPKRCGKETTRANPISTR
jgi:hypothetical protein